MDILNFISWIKSGRVVNTVDPAQALLPVGLKDNRRDDGYLAGAISVEDLVTQLTPTPTYNVFTALLTQSGGDNPDGDANFPLVIGRTYQIGNPIPSYTLGDFTNVGAPNNNIGTSFIATGTTPNSWGTNISLSWNTGAPVATVLENTIGNVWFSYGDVGIYSTLSNDLFIENKSLVLSTPTLYSNFNIIQINPNINNMIITTINTSTNTNEDGLLNNTPIEIRVYN